MKTVLGAGLLMLIATATPAMAAGPADFTGHWRVAGVAVTDTGVQALTDDDPSLMGKRLTFTTQRLGWDRPTATNDACIGPSFTHMPAMPPAELRPQLRKLGMRAPVAYAIHCRSGSWGPDGGGIVYRGIAGALAMPWYDGGVLKLVR